MALAKPYTIVDAAKQSEDIDRMLDELYQLAQESTTGNAGARGAQGAVGVGVPGNDGDDGEYGVPGLLGPIGPMGPIGLGIPGNDGEDGTDAQWITGPTGPAVSLANPTASVGLTAVNGVATTAIRSDGAPALSQAIAPTWSAAHTFSELIAASKGISFPATQVASAGANDLDDYEEGTWTPVLGGAGGTSGQTYTTQLGAYAKVGQLVYICFDLTLSAKGTITGALQIQGAPLTSGNSGIANGLVIGYFSNLATSVVLILGHVRNNSTASDLYMLTAAATTPTGMATADVGNTTRLMGAGCYLVAT